MENLLKQFESIARSDWLATAGVALAMLIVTALLSWIVTKFLRRLLQQEALLPSSTIFINIARGTIWFLGICTILTTCYNVNVTAMVAALGVGGIAISLGFQDTISNLIGGLQVSLMKLVQPGDNISVGTNSGIVEDVTWRHTAIVDSLGETVIIPNSIIGKTALVKLPPVNQVAIPFVVLSDGKNLSEVAKAIEAGCVVAAGAVVQVTKQPKVVFLEITESGFRGKVTFSVEDAGKAGAASDAALRAIAPLTREGGALMNKATDG